MAPVMDGEHGPVDLDAVASWMDEVGLPSRRPVLIAGCPDESVLAGFNLGIVLEDALTRLHAAT
jgi:hypothetical protein